MTSRILISLVLALTACVPDITSDPELATTRQGVTIGATVPAWTGHASTASMTATTISSPFMGIQFSGGSWVVPLSAQPGDVIPSITATVQDSAGSDQLHTGGNAVIMALVVNGSIVSSGGTTLQATSSGSGAVQALTIVTPYTVPATATTVAVYFIPLSSGGAITTPSACGAVVVRAASTSVPATINVPVIPTGFVPNFVRSFSTVNTATNGGVGFTVTGVPVGAIITTIRAKVQDNAGATVTLALSTKEMPGLTVPVWSSYGPGATSSGTGAIQLLTDSGIGYIVQSSTELAVTITANGIGLVPLNTYAVELDYQ